jgi:hypothetical protein
MNSNSHEKWVESVAANVASYRHMIDATVAQLSDAELRERPRPDMNSVAVLLRHLGGNLQSRWTDFLTTDGEKPGRNRDSEFTDWSGERAELIAYFDTGWRLLTDAIDLIRELNDDQEILIRGERHTIADALMRSVAHVSYHVGQIAIISRMVHRGEWQWLTIAPGKSAEHNSQTWGTARSRSVFSGEKNAK